MKWCKLFGHKLKEKQSTQEGVVTDQVGIISNMRLTSNITYCVRCGDVNIVNTGVYLHTPPQIVAQKKTLPKPDWIEQLHNKIEEAYEKNP